MIMMNLTYQYLYHKFTVRRGLDFNPGHASIITLTLFYVSRMGYVAFVPMESLQQSNWRSDVRELRGNMHETDDGRTTDRSS